MLNTDLQHSKRKTKSFPERQNPLKDNFVHDSGDGNDRENKSTNKVSKKPRKENKTRRQGICFNNLYIKEHIQLTEMALKLEVQKALSAKFMVLYNKYSEEYFRKVMLSEMKEIEDNFTYWLKVKRKFVENLLNLVPSSSKKDTLSEHYVGVFNTLDTELFEMQRVRERLQLHSDDSFAPEFGPEMDCSLSTKFEDGQITVNPPEKILQVDQNKLQKTNDRLSVELLQVKSCDKNNNDGFKPNTLDVRGVTGFNREDLNLTDGQDLEWAVNNFLSARNTANVDKIIASSVMEEKNRPVLDLPSMYEHELQDCHTEYFQLTGDFSTQTEAVADQEIIDCLNSVLYKGIDQPDLPITNKYDKHPSHLKPIAMPKGSQENLQPLHEVTGGTWQVPLLNFTCCPSCYQTVNNSELCDHIFKVHVDRKCSMCTVLLVKEMLKLAPLHEHFHKILKSNTNLSSLKCTVTTKPAINLTPRSVAEVSCSDDVYVCEVCETECVSNYRLHKHYINSHVLKHWRRFICKLCLTLFLNEDRLRKHLKQHHMILKNKCSNKIVCIVCYKEFEEGCVYVEHLKNDHHTNSLVRGSYIEKTSGLKGNKCLHCNLYFTNKKVRVVHTIIIHNTHPYVCSCSAKFFSKGLLDMHIMSSTDCETKAKQKCCLEGVKVYPFYK